MFSRFDDAARRVLRAAEQECRNLNHYYVGVEHLLLALLDEHDPSIEGTLSGRGLVVEELQTLTRRVLGTGEDRQWEGILLTPRLRAVFELAEQRANGALVTPSDLLLAIEREGGGTAASLLRGPQQAPSRRRSASVE